MTEIQPFRLYRRWMVSGILPGRRRLRVSAAALAVAWIVGGQAAHAASANINVQANALKPLLITKLQDLDLGSITLGPGTWSNAAVALSQTGVFVCPPLNVTCTGVTSVAKYNLQGSNQQVVRISAPNVTMINQSDQTKTLTLVVDCPPTIILPNSGQPGIDVSVGGSINLSSSTVPGTYRGTFNFTADYQ